MKDLNFITSDQYDHIIKIGEKLPSSLTLQGFDMSATKTLEINDYVNNIFELSLAI